MLLAIIVAAAVPTTSMVAVTTVTATVAVSTIVVLRWVLFETLVLFLDIVKKILAEFFGALDIISIRTTGLC